MDQRVSDIIQARSRVYQGQDQGLVLQYTCMPEGENCTTISPNCGAVQDQGQLVTGGCSRSKLEVVELTRLLIDPFVLLPSAWGGCVWREVTMRHVPFSTWLRSCLAPTRNCET